MTPFQRVTAALCFGCLAIQVAEAKSNLDVVVMKNGDRLTGEIKGLENGFLYFKAAYMAETVPLDWKLVDRLSSADEFNVLLTDGSRKIGKILKASEIDPDAQTFSVESDAVVTRA